MGNTRNLKLRLIILSFLQFFVWGAWLLSFGKYMSSTLHFDGKQIGAIFMTLGIASIFMPGIMGVIADRWTGPNKLYAVSHLLGAVLLYFMAQAKTFGSLYWATLLYLMLYMPTISLNYSVSYCLLKKGGYKDVVKEFPPIRVWGTIGFIAAVWITDLMGWGTKNTQFYFSAVSSIILGLYTFTLPDCPIEKGHKRTLSEALGIDALKLFGDKKMATFFIFAMLLGAALQITNMWGEAFLHDFSKIPKYANALVVRYNGILMSLSQISETLFILTIPFFLKRYGIKNVMLMSMFAWFFRFGLFALGSPVGWGLVALILSMIVYGMAFDFFNISGSLFVETETDPKIRASAQGLFLIMTNGLGAMIGAYGSGYIIDLFTKNGIRDWHAIWSVFSLYALTIAILFMISFKYKHDPHAIEQKLEGGLH